jgi:Spy/CpxP family protein refolding chaperone
MTRTTTRGLATGAVALALLLAGSAALAGQGFRGGREGAPGRGIRAALATLDLTDDQKAKLKELAETERTRREAFREEGRTAREALRAAAAAASPDPAAVGAAFLRVDAHRKAIRAERGSSREKLEAILTAEQKAKLEGWRSAHRQMRRGEAGRRDRGLRRGGPRPPVD